MTTWHTRSFALLAMLLMLPAVGCTVNRPDGKPAGSERVGNPVPFVGDDAVRLDLTNPPTAAELGVSTGSDTVSFWRSGSNSMLDVDFQLPEGRELNVPAIGYHVVLAPGPYGNAIIVNRVEPSLDAAEAVLLADAAMLRMDGTEISSFTNEVRGTDLNSYGPITGSSLAAALVTLRSKSTCAWSRRTHRC